jgi:hypothetical protein
MEDLIKLNRRIAQHWLGSLDSQQEAYLSYVPVCLGQLTYGAAELNQVVTRFKTEQRDLLRIAKLNRRYLNFARLAAKDAVAGKPEILIKLGITLEQAEVLGKLTDEEVAGLAFSSKGPIVYFASQAFRRGSALRVRAAKHHATAFVATRARAKAKGIP